MSKISSLYYVLGVLVIFSCGENEYKDLSISQLNEPFEIGYDETVVIDGVLLKITFADVLSDSRCPVNVACIWSGALTIGLVVNNQKVEISNLNHPSLELKSDVMMNNFLITFLPEPINPIPHSAVQYDLGAYRVYLRVQKM